MPSGIGLILNEFAHGFVPSWSRRHRGHPQKEKRSSIATVSDSTDPEGVI